MKKFLIILLFVSCLFLTSTVFAITPEEAIKYIGKTVIVNREWNGSMDGSNRITYVGKILQFFIVSHKGTERIYLSLLLGFEERHTGFPTYNYYVNQKVVQLRLESIMDITELKDIIQKN